ncbi:autotransporter-associated beta strand repeat-containing protein, partial [Pelagibacteraceae bacterium]|nr:autotransporter-associated beta strand repeat-containing protein [Pelagibacteraceae bacterium]
FTASGAGTLILTSASTYSGTTSVSSGTTFKVSGSGSLGSVSSDVYTYAGQITNAGTFIYASDATQVLSGKVTGVGSLQKTTETSTLTLSSSSSDYTGSTTISAGTIKITNANALGATPGSADADNIIFNGGTLQTTADITLGTNKGITLTGNGTINADASTTLTYGGVITGSADLTKSGSGTLTLSGINTYTGSTTISGGQLNIYAESGLGANPGTFVADQLIFNGGTIFNANGANISFNANRGVTLTGDGIIKVNNASTITIPGVITGSGSLTLSETLLGTLTLSASNTYTGQTIISSGGTLFITNANGLGNSSTGTTVSNGAMLKISGGITVAEPITINGSGVSSNGAIYFLSGNNTYSGAITLGSNSTITSDAGNQTISGTVNGAYTLEVTAAGNWTQSGIVGGTSPLTQYEVNAGSNDVSLSASLTLAGPLNIYGDDITVGSIIDTSAGGVSGDILFKVKSNIDHNSGANITTNGGDIIYWADSDNNSVGVISIRGALTIETSGGHFWMGGGAASGTAWNSLTVGDGRAVSTSATIEDHGILIYNTTINTGSGDIYIAGETQDNSSVTYGSYLEAVDIDTTSGDITIIGKATGNGSTKVGKTAAVQISATSSTNTTINSTSGNISITGTNASSIRADYAAGIWIGGAFHGNGSSFNGDVSIETGAGSISLTANASDTNVSTGWRHGIALITRYANENVTVKTNSGNITFDATANYQSNTSDQSAFQIQTVGSSSDIKVISQTGDITIIAEMLSTQEDDGQYENGIRITAANDTDNIMIGYDGTNAYSGDIIFRSNSILQRNVNAGSGSISVRTSGSLTFEPKDGAFTYLRASSGSSLTFDDDWNFGTTLSSLTIGKSTNTSDITFSNALSVAGPIVAWGNDVTLTGSLVAAGAITITANQDIILNTNTITSSASNTDIILRAKRDITTQTNDTTSLAVTSTGGNILFTSDTDDTNGGGILILGGTVIDSNGGDITFAGGDISGSGYATGRSVANSGWYIEGLRIGGTASNIVDIDSDGGNIIMRGKTSNNGGTGTSITAENGGAGLSFYSTNVDINSGTGTLYLEGQSYTYGSIYSAGINFGIRYSAYTFNLSSSNTTSNAIRIVGNHNINQTSGYTYGLVSFTSGTIQATGLGGGIRIDTEATGDIYGLAAAQELNILAASGPIQLLDTRAGGYLYFGAAPYIGSKSGSSVTSSSSDITIQFDSFSWGGQNSKYFNYWSGNCKTLQQLFPKSCGCSH